MKKILSFFLISLCFLGCAHAIHNVYMKYDITSEYDEYNGLRTTKMNNNLIGNFSANKRIYLDAERLDFDTGETIFRILITYVGKDWIFIKKGNSLIFLIDKDKLTLNGNGSSANRDVISGGTVIERDIYIITRQELQKI